MYDLEDFETDISFEESNVSVCNTMLIGVGGAGCNTIRRLLDSDVTSTVFVGVNTDRQQLIDIKKQGMLKKPNMPVKLIQIGKKLTKGQGAGAQPQIGRDSAIESEEDIRNLLQDVQLLFLTAGMGGGTGTGASPVIAKIAREMGILVIAIVFKPHSFERVVRLKYAEQGVKELKKYVDSLIVIPNDRLSNAHMLEGYARGDDVIRKALKGIAELIGKPTLINLDYADLCKIVKNKGLAHIGIGKGEGDSAELQAVSAAVKNALTDTTIKHASGMIISYSSGRDFDKNKIEQATNLVNELLRPNAEVIFGLDIDPELGDQVNVIIIATGFEQDEEPQQGNTNPQRTFEPIKAEPTSQDNEGRIGVDSDYVPSFVQKIKK